MVAPVILVAGLIAAGAREPLASTVVVEGMVTSIRHLAPPGAAGRVRITLQLRSGPKGAASGRLLAFDEWDTLWKHGDRYRVGQPVVLELYRDSQLGLTSSKRGVPQAKRSSRSRRDGNSQRLREVRPCSEIAGRPCRTPRDVP